MFKYEYKVHSWNLDCEPLSQKVSHVKPSSGVWALEEAEKMPLTGDRGLVLKSKAKHAAISVPLRKPFTFLDKPLVVQYEVNLQNGQECGGAYIKVRPC